MPSISKAYASLTEQSRTLANLPALSSTGLRRQVHEILIFLSTAPLVWRLSPRYFRQFLFLTVVAKKDGEIIGCVYLRGARYSKGDGGRANLAMFVTDGNQERGVGTRLVKEMLDFARERGIKHIKLWVYSHNVRALKLYTKYGFRESEKIMDLDV